MIRRLRNGALRRLFLNSMLILIFLCACAADHWPEHAVASLMTAFGLSVFEVAVIRILVVRAMVELASTTVDDIGFPVATP
jgi:hypothetical protein